MKILVVGCGGIGSYLVGILGALVNTGQISMDVEITLADDDTVEKKNILYQNFEESDILDYKAEILADTYGFLSQLKRLKKKSELEGYDIIIGAVDNSKFRKLLYKTCVPEKGPYWIDLRSEGSSVAFFTKSSANTVKAMLGTIDVDNEESTSCQLEYELSEGIIQLGNRVIANIGAQLLLNRLRGKDNADKFIHRF